MKYTWKTERGAQIALDIETEIITEETIYSDGFNVKVPCHDWKYTINSLLVNGKEVKDGAHKTTFGRCPDYYYAYGIRLMGRDAYIKIPDDIEQEIYGAERTYRAEKLKKEMEAEKAYEAHRKAVLDILNK